MTNGGDDCVQLGLGVELSAQASDVVEHRVVAQTQIGCDLRGRDARGNNPQDLRLTAAERTNGDGLGRRSVHVVAEAGDGRSLGDGSTMISSQRTPLRRRTARPHPPRSARQDGPREAVASVVGNCQASKGLESGETLGVIQQDLVDLGEAGPHLSPQFGALCVDASTEAVALLVDAVAEALAL